MNDTYIYVIGCKFKSEAFIKIGVSKSPQKRLKSIQTGNPMKVMILQLSDCMKKSQAYKIEKMLHNLMEDHMSNGEWFVFNYDKYYDKFIETFKSLTSTEGYFNKLKQDLSSNTTNKKEGQVITTSSSPSLIEKELELLKRSLQ